jgi:hypothetical protein
MNDVCDCRGEYPLRHRMRAFLILSCLMLALPVALYAQVLPLVRAHAHNDYEHPRPLLDALAAGFCNVEADVYRIKGQLLVAHDREDLKPERDLETLYLKPLLQRVRQNGGRVHPGGPVFHLMIDFKSAAEPTYALLREVLPKYREMLSEFQGKSVMQRAVTLIISGNRPTDLISLETQRFAFVDGRLTDMEGDHLSRDVIPWISENWRQHFKWDGQGEIPEEEAEKLQRWIQHGHAQGRKIRFWATPETETFWRLVHGMGLDLINTDKLEHLARVLSELEP